MTYSFLLLPLDFQQTELFLSCGLFTGKVSVFKVKGKNGFFRQILTLRYARLKCCDKLWRFGQGSTRGTSKAKILSTSHHWNALVQVAALKQLLLAGPCIPPHMLVQNDHPLSDYNSQTLQLFNIETTVQDKTCTWW